MSEEKRMVGSYEITHSVHIGENEIVMGEDLTNKTGHYYIVANCKNTELYKSYENCLVSDDFTELAEVFAKRVTRQIDKLKDEQKNLPVTSFLRSDECTPLKIGENLKYKAVAIKPEALRPEYRTASQQLYFASGGNGTRGYSRGSAVFCVNLYDNTHTRFERSDIMGTLEPEKLPEWAKRNFNKLMEIDKKNKDMER